MAFANPTCSKTFGELFCGECRTDARHGLKAGGLHSALQFKSVSRASVQSPTRLVAQTDRSLASLALALVHDCIFQVSNTSSIYVRRTLLEISGTFQLFTSHHHLLTFAPTDCPCNCEDLFICLQPETTSVHAIPCTKGIKI